MEKETLQDEILNEVKGKDIEVVIYLTRGNRISGKVIEHDKFTVLVESEGQKSLIYKHAISTIVLEQEV